VSVLEHFKEKRIRAVILLRLGGVLGYSLMYGIAYIPGITFHWRTIFRCQTGLAAIGVCAGCCLVPLSLTTETGDHPKKGVWARTLGAVDWSFIQNIMLYLLMAVIYFDQLGELL
jgi:predicted MFS family arabinose efflux permease